MAGKRVLMVNGDSQCKLTEISVQGIDDLDGRLNLFDEQIDFSLMRNNVYEYFESYFFPNRGQSQKPMLYEKREGLHLLPGFIRFAEQEETISLSVVGINGLNQVSHINL